MTGEYLLLFSTQALDTISEIGDRLKVKYSRQPVPDYSENDEDFCKRFVTFLVCLLANN